MTLTKRILSLISMTVMALAILIAIGPRSQARAADCFNPYAVGPTESWHSIANVCGIPFQALRDANPSHIRRGDILFTGELLTLPERDPKPESGPSAYTVAPGDSWYRIAQDHGLTFRDVRAFNPHLWLKRHEIIRPGDQMTLPLLVPVAEEVVIITDTAEAPAEAPAVETQPAFTLDASGCPTVLDFGPAYSAGGLLKVVSAAPLDLYVAQGDRSQVAGQVAPDTILKVLTDTSCIDGWLWWQVTDEVQGLTGWAAVEFTAVPVLDPITE